MKRLLCVIIAAILMISGSLIMVNAQEAKMEYVFSGADSASAGYAEGTVTLTAPDGDYLLYWADEAGALDGWYPIADVTVAGGSGAYAFGERVAIPVGATRLIAVAAAGGAEAASCSVPAYKRLAYTESDRLYRCEVLSDIHIDCQDGGANVYYTDASARFARALDVAAERQADFVITAGDQVTNASGATLEWLEYQRVLAASDYDGPVYEAIGNHEMRYAAYSDCDPDCGVEEYIIATGLGGTAAAMADRRPYYALTEPVSGDHFIFMALEATYTPAESDEFSDEQIAWLEDLLRRYSGDGHRIFLIQHALIYGYGAGDDSRDPAYGGSMTATAEYPNNLRFKQLIEQYRDVIWLSGHTHVDLRDGVNFSDEGGFSCLMFHVPSVAATTRLSYDEDGSRTLDRTFYDDATQGYIMDAYSEAVLLCGVNFSDDQSYPAYTYIVGATQAGEEPTQAPFETTSAPTEQPTEAPSEPTAVPTEQPAEQPAEPSFVWGDADGDGELTVLDATAIQRHLADIQPIADENLPAALVDGEVELNIIDATLIQRRLADIIFVFPVEEGLAPTAAAFDAAMVKAELDAYYPYASYPQYAALKRAYRLGDTAAMQSAMAAFRALRERVGLTTVYFSDSKGLGHPYAYAWNSSSGDAVEAWRGQKMTYVRTNSLSQQIYAVTVDRARYDSMVINWDEQKTVDIRLAPQSGRVYYPISDSSPYQVGYSVMERLWRTDSGAAATVYFTDTEGWGKPYLYYWTSEGNNKWPGTAMTYVRKSSSGKSIYKATVPAEAKVIFSDGDQRQTADIPAVAGGFGYYPYTQDEKGKWIVAEYWYGADKGNG